MSQQGFAITPIEKIRVQQLLTDQPQLLLSAAGREKLGTLLAPLLAKNAMQQRQFYQTYQRYLTDLTPQATVEYQPPPGPTFLQKWLPLILGAMLMAGIIWYIQFSASVQEKDHFYFRTKTKAEGKIDWQIHPENFTIPVGTNLFFENKTHERFHKEVTFDWQWMDATTYKTEAKQANVFHWEFKISPTKDGHLKQVVMITKDKTSLEELDRDTAQITITCSDAPKISVINTDPPPSVGTDIQFSTPVAANSDYSYRWDFGDGDTSRQEQPIHQFKAKGKYSVQLTIKNKNGNAPNCQSSFQKEIDLNPRLPDIPTFTLEEDLLNRQWEWGWATILLIFGLLGAAVYNWWRWYKRPDENKIREEQAAMAFKARLEEVVDEPPYAIPYEDKNPVIEVQSAQFNIAKSLRERQEGTRLQMDVPGTVRSTVEGGGFPSLQFSYTSRPTDYVFLIDLQAADSHQARLFQYLIDLWEQQDVHFDLFYYKNDFEKVWHPQSQESNTLEELHRMMPNRRLIIFGDAYTLLNTTEEVTLQLAYSAALRKWEDRLLITPVPIASWTYREARLYSLFPIFHADLAGLLQATQFIGAGKSEEDLPPTLRKWEEALRRNSVDVDTHREWEDIDDHKDYLEQHPEVLRWLMALMVHPNPTWNVTIAIGKAISAPVTYENLLLLARIPWLQNGDLDLDLWEEIWDEGALSKKDERKARAAVKEELEAVRAQTAKGYAKRALETNLIIHDFALDPHSVENQAAVRFLTNQEFVDPIIEEELDWIVKRHVEGHTEGNGVGETVRLFLEKEQPAIAPPIDTIHFWAAITYSLLGLFTLFFVNIVDSDRLSSWIDDQEFSPQEMVEKPIRNFHFIYETENAADLAVELNNEAVKMFNGEAVNSREVDFSTPYVATFNYISPIADSQTIAISSCFFAALTEREDYELAKLNLAKFFHNKGMEQYAQFTTQDSFLTNAQIYLKSAMELWEELPDTYDTLGLHTLHGLATTYHFQNQPDTSCFLLKEILRRTNGVFFTAINQDKIPSLFSLAKSDCLQNPSEINVNIISKSSSISAMAREIENEIKDLGYKTRRIAELPEGNSIEYYNEDNLLFAQHVAEKINTLLAREGLKPLVPRFINAINQTDQISVFLEFKKPSATVTIEGSVIDRISQKLLGDVRISRESSSKVITTSPRGVFSFVEKINDRKKIKLSFSKSGYYPYTIEIPITETSDILIQLKRKEATVTDVSTPPTKPETPPAPEQDPDTEDNEDFTGGGNETHVPFSVYFDINEPAGKSNQTTTSANYKELYQRYNSESRIEKYVQENTKGLSGTEEAELLSKKFLAEMDTRSFFEQKVAYGMTKLDLLARYLEKKLLYGEEIELEITGFKRLGNSPDYSQSILSRRISSVETYLSSYNGGILRDFLANNSLKLRLTPIDSAPLANEDGPLRDIQPGYSIPAALERSVTFAQINISAPQQITSSISQQKKEVVELYKSTLEKLNNYNDYICKDLVQENIRALKNYATALETQDHTKQTIGQAIATFKTKAAAWLKEVEDCKNKTITPTTSSPTLIPEMVRVQGGTFDMGCTPEQKKDCEDNEKPVRRDVQVKDFSIGKYEITVAEYLAFADETDSNYPEWLETGSRFNIETGIDNLYKARGYSRLTSASNLPIVGVSWDNAKAYCQWLSSRTGKRFRLPTEAEWEYAARGGSKSKNSKYSGSNIIEEVAWYNPNSDGRTHSIEETNQKLKPNELGIYNMSGNVWEWIEDCWHDNYNDAPTNQEAWLEANEGNCSRRVLRGGSWYEDNNLSRTSNRDSSPTFNPLFTFGFRVAQD